jgi:hypothetical protein
MAVDRRQKQANFLPGDLVFLGSGPSLVRIWTLEEINLDLEIEIPSWRLCYVSRGSLALVLPVTRWDVLGNGAPHRCVMIGELEKVAWACEHDMQLVT